MIGIALLLAGSPVVDLPKLQRQLDFMVSICRADEVVRLVAHDGNKVAIEMLTSGSLPTVTENTAFQCALAKVEERSDQQIIAAPKAQRK